MSLTGVAILCWEENRPWVSALRQRGMSVRWVEQPKGDVHLQIPGVEPDVLVVDLTRMPDAGRGMILDLAASGQLEDVPVIIVSESTGADRGLRSKVDRISVARPDRVVSAVESVLA